MAQRLVARQRAEGLVDSVLDGIADGAGADALSVSVHPVIRIKAVQDFSPSEAVASVLSLKRTIKGLITDGDRSVLDELEDLTDDLLCSCFDIYMDCRRKLSEIKEDETRRNLFMVLKKANALDISEHGGE